MMVALLFYGYATPFVRARTTRTFTAQSPSTSNYADAVGTYPERTTRTR